MLTKHFRLVPLLIAALALVALGRRVLATPNNVYVNAAWLGTSPGTPVSGTINGGGFTATYGTDAFATISAGVTAVATNGNVWVLAGTYNEFPDVTKTVNLRGQQYNVDARTRSSGSETILNNSIALEADNIELNGFTIQGGDLVNDWSGAGVYTSYLNSGYLIGNNIIQNNILGIYLNSSKPASNATQVYRNLIQNNNYGYGVDTQDANGNGIYSDFGLDEVLIDSNKFTGHQNASMVLQFAGTPGNAVVVSNNSIVNDSTLTIFSSQNIQLTNNSIVHPSGAGVFIGGGVQGVTMTGNTIRNATNVGIGIANLVGSPNSSISAHRNSIFSNAVGQTIRSVTYPEGVGYFNDAGATSDTPDITCNWWGAVSGPKASTNPTGTGNWVVGAGTYNPWSGAIELTSQFSITLLSTLVNSSTHQYLQVVRATNNGPLAAVGQVNLVVDNLPSSPATTLVNATGTWTDACLPPQPSPMYQITPTGQTLLPGQSVNLTLKFQTTGSFATNKIGGNASVSTRVMAAGAL